MSAAEVTLVTGGAGYIGSHVAKALASQGHKVVVFDDLSTGHEYLAHGHILERGSLLDQHRLGEVIERHAPRAVIHLAGSAYVGESNIDPGKYYRNNVGGTLNLLTAMRDSGVEKLVFSSSCATYGIPSHIPISEDQPQHPINPYGRSKLVAEMMMRDFSAAHGLRSVALRYFNAAGASADGDIGEDHDPETHLIPLAINAATGRAAALRIFGDDYDTPDGTCIRDYVHVSDLADAHVKALTWLDDHDGFSAFNLANERGNSVRDVIAAVEKATSLRVPHSIGKRRPGDPARLVGDAARAQRMLGWKPLHSSLDEIIASACRWHRRTK
ncbi:MAG: UDP-glucose 4-epimerase GalE [Rhodobiaceae bacterium]|nr:UDP-glucose 4-epimerase GalE [Rhodobiaceae bacterium]